MKECSADTAQINTNEVYEYKPGLTSIQSGLYTNKVPTYTPTDSENHGTVRTLQEVFGTFPKVKYPCKHGGEIGYSDDRLAAVIVHLNDQCGWSREQIADWLDTLDIDLTIKPSKGEEVNA